MAFFYFSSTTKDAQEEFFTAFIRVYIKYIASLYHKFNSLENGEAQTQFLHIPSTTNTHIQENPFNTMKPRELA